MEYQRYRNSLVINLSRKEKLKWKILKYKKKEKNKETTCKKTIDNNNKTVNKYLPLPLAQNHPHMLVFSKSL